MRHRQSRLFLTPPGNLSSNRHQFRARGPIECEALTESWDQSGHSTPRYRGLKIRSGWRFSWSIGSTFRDFQIPSENSSLRKTRLHSTDLEILVNRHHGAQFYQRTILPSITCNTIIPSFYFLPLRLRNSKDLHSTYLAPSQTTITPGHNYPSSTARCSPPCVLKIHAGHTRHVQQRWPATSDSRELLRRIDSGHHRDESRIELCSSRRELPLRGTGYQGTNVARVSSRKGTARLRGHWQTEDTGLADESRHCGGWSRRKSGGATSGCGIFWGRGGSRRTVRSGAYWKGRGAKVGRTTAGPRGFWRPLLRRRCSGHHQRTVPSSHSVYTCSRVAPPCQPLLLWHLLVLLFTVPLRLVTADLDAWSRRIADEAALCGRCSVMVVFRVIFLRLMESFAVEWDVAACVARKNSVRWCGLFFVE